MAPDAASPTPPLWLLQLGVEGIPLTEKHALARTVVREAAERWPTFYASNPFGPPHREADVPPLTEVREGLLRLKLLRRRGRRLLTTPRGRELLEDPSALLALLTGDLGAGEPFVDMVAAAIRARLATGDPAAWEELQAVAGGAAARGGWRTADGRPPDDRALSWVVGEVLCRGEGYGLLMRGGDPDHPTRRLGPISLTPAGEALHRLGRRSSAGMKLLVFRAELVSGLGSTRRGVSAQLAVRADQPLTALHDAIQEAFGWYDDHLYSFWLDGKFWSDDEVEFTSPVTPDHGVATADLPLAELDLAVGQNLAYVFDFGDEWRVRLTLREERESDDGPYPRVLERKGTAPPQYEELGE